MRRPMRLQRGLRRAQDQRQEDSRDRDDMGRIEQRQIGEIVIIDDRARQRRLIRGKADARREVV